MADIMCSKFFFRQGLLFKLKKKAEKGKVVPFRRANLASSNMILLKDSNKVFYKKRRPRLLFATGNQFLRSHFSDCFPAKDALCFFAQDTLDVASVFENHLLDFVIIDAALPFGSGLEVCRLIKSHKNFQKIPVLLFSQKKFPFSFESQEYQENLVVYKSFTKKNLIQMVESLLTKQGFYNILIKDS